MATIPAGITGLALEHLLRTQFAKPLAAATFLTINGGILLLGERLRRRDAVRILAARHGEVTDSASGSTSSVDPAGGGPRRRLDTLEVREAGVIGFAQILPLLAGFSRSGVTMVAGLLRGLDHEDAARFSFLLAAPIILAAGLLKVPDLTGSLGNGVRGQIFVGCACRLRHRVLLCAFPAALLRDEDSDTVRHLLPDRWRRLDRQICLIRKGPSSAISPRLQRSVPYFVTSLERAPECELVRVLEVTADR